MRLNKKAEAVMNKGSEAGLLVGIITLLLVFYVLWLPPTEKAEIPKLL